MVITVAQSYPTLCDFTDYSLPGSSVCGILQERILEWVAIAFSGIFWPGIEPVSLVSPVLVSGFFTTVLPGKPNLYIHKY